MKLELWYTEFNPYSSWDISNNTPYSRMIENINITQLDSLSLDGVSYTEQEGRIVGVSDIDCNDLGSFFSRIIGDPISSPISKFLATRVLIRNDDNSVYIDGLILRSTVNYDSYRNKLSFSISDMMAVLIEWFGKVKVNVSEDNVWGVQVDEGTTTIYEYSADNLDGRFTFSDLLSQINESKQFDKVIPNYNYGGTVKQQFEIQSNVTSTIIVENQVRTDTKYYSSKYTIIDDPTFPIITGIAQVGDTLFDIILLEIIQFPEVVNLVTYQKFMIKPWIYRFDNGFFSIIEPEPDDETLMYDDNMELTIQTVVPITVTYGTIQGAVVAGTGYQYNYAFASQDDFVNVIKGLCRRNSLAEITWTTREMPQDFTVTVSNADINARLIIRTSTVRYYNIQGQESRNYKVKAEYILEGDFAYDRTKLNPGQYTMKDLLKDISLSTDNYLYYDGGSVFKLASRSSDMINSVGILQPDQISSHVKGLDLNVSVKLSLTKIDDERYDFNGELKNYYQNIVNENYNTEIEVLAPPVIGFELGNNVTINGRIYKIFGINFFNGLYRLKLYGKGYTK